MQATQTYLISRSSILYGHFNYIFDGLCKLYTDPDVNAKNDYLPYSLEGLFNMLSDSNREIRQAADLALSEFFREFR